MIRFVLGIVMLGAAIALASPGAHALTFRVHANSSTRLTAVLASGMIQEGDAKRLDQFLSGLPSRANTAVYLASPGGNLYEGMRLGLYFKSQRIKTVVEGGEDCASACAVAFLGGTDANGRPWRSSSDNSRLGFHAFRGIQEMSISTDQVQSIVADLLRFGKLVDAPIELLIAGFATPSAEMFWVSQSDVCALGIKLWSNTYKKFVCNQ